MNKLIGIITNINPLTNTIEIKSKNGTFYYFKPVKIAVISKYKVGQTFVYEGFGIKACDYDEYTGEIK